MVAPDIHAAVRERVHELDESWFAVASTYVSLAQRDGEPAVVARLNAVYAAAVEAKEATLRPEIRLLNRLLRAKDEAGRAELLAQHAADLARRARLVCTAVACVRLTRARARVCVCCAATMATSSCSWRA